jgi:hypothetical protein
MGTTSGSLIYTVPTIDYNSSDFPFYSTTSIITKNIEIIDDNIKVTFNFTINVFNSDGLTFENFSNSSNLIIETFNFVPLYSGGNQFKNFNGKFPISVDDIPIVKFNTSFENCFLDSNIIGSIENWNVPFVNNLDRTFKNSNFVGNLYNGNNFGGNLSSWNIFNVRTMNETFMNCLNFNDDISGWNTGLVEIMTSTFENCHSFNQNLANWNLTSITSMNKMLNNTILSTSNYSNTLIGWYENSNTPNSINFGALGLVANTEGNIAKENLINIKQWTIIDGKIPCFHESVTILCYINNKKEYINIKNISVGDNVVTYKDGIKKVKLIKIKTTFNKKNKNMSNFFILEKNKKNILTHDLIITGKHSSLVDIINEKNKKIMSGIYKNKYNKIHDKYKLLSYLDNNFICKNDEITENVYIIVLEGNDKKYTYGIYVNGGYLVESCGEQYIN